MQNNKIINYSFVLLIFSFSHIKSIDGLLFMMDTTRLEKAEKKIQEWQEFVAREADRLERYYRGKEDTENTERLCAARIVVSALTAKQKSGDGFCLADRFFQAMLDAVKHPEKEFNLNALSEQLKRCAN